MKRHSSFVRRGTGGAILLALLLLAGAPGWADEAEEKESAESLGEALLKGKVSLFMRYRYEWVSDDSEAVADNDAKASTLRTALGYRTLPLHGVSLLLEFENVKSIGPDDEYNNKGVGHIWNSVSDHPVVADPELTEVNQAYVDVAFSGTDIKLGRQIINIDDQRFVGAVGWRQNWQTFDAVSVSNTSIPNTTLTYAFVDNVNNIVGGNLKMASHLAHAKVGLGSAGNLNVFAYLLDYDLEANWGLSRSTYGARFDGSPKMGDDWKLLYDAAAALQQDFADNPASVDAQFYRAEIGAAYKTLSFKVGNELLSGDANDGKFLTPLATLHKFNGWADKFLATPDTGLNDLYLSVGGKHGTFGWSAVYHDFSADEGSADYGTEIDVLATYKAPWKQVFGVKSAFYDADSFSADTSKVMVFTVYSF